MFEKEFGFLFQVFELSNFVMCWPPFSVCKYAAICYRSCQFKCR